MSIIVLMPLLILTCNGGAGESSSSAPPLGRALPVCILVAAHCMSVIVGSDT